MVADKLRQQLDRYDPALPVARAWTPPSSWYLDTDLFDLEQTSVFRSSWLFAARASQVATAGSYVAGTAGGEPFVVTRDRDGTLRAFYNVCQHHAAIIADGAGCAEFLTCPYHGWSYHLDGALRKAPRLGAIEQFDVAQFGLKPIQVAEWRQFVFIHLGEPRAPLAEQLAELDRRLDHMTDRPLRYVSSQGYDIACNWKVFVDNYLDGGYHIPHAHRELDSQIDMGSYRTELFDRYSIQSCPGRGDAAASEISGDSLHGRIGGGALYAWLFPNFMLNRYGPALDTNLVIPLAHDRTRVIIDFYFEPPDGPDGQSFIERSLISADVTQREDVALCESVQRGLRSSAYDRGRFAPDIEIGEHHFHRLLAADMREALDRRRAEELSGR